MCGILGIINRRASSYYSFDGLRTLQHRGEESAGMITFDVSDGKYRELKGAGLVSEVFNKTSFKHLKGSVTIGHTRYPTSGKLDTEDIILNAQPYYVESPCFIAAAQNGQFTNYPEMKKALEKSGRYIKTSGDLEPFLKLFSESLSRHMITNELKDKYIINAVKDVRKKAKGGYSIIMLLAIGKNVKLVAFTGEVKIRPLLYGRKGSSVCIASETSVLDVLEYKYASDVRYDEVVIVNNNGKTRKVRIGGKGNAFCMFEWTYFSRPDSVIEGVSVYDVRVRLGEILANKERKGIDMVVPIPKSGYKYAEGFGHGIGIQPTYALYKNDYIGRMFIRPPGERQKVKRAKLNPIKGQITGRTIALLDDSIVRGDTMKRNVALVRNAGAKEVHIRIFTPKLISPCYYGIDMATPEQFIAHSSSVATIQKKISADSLVYTTIDNLVSAIGIHKRELCLGCLTGRYPTDASKLKKNQTKTTGKRPYES